MYEHLLDTDAIFLTVNSRLARHLLSTFDQQENNTDVHETPTVLPLQTWLTQQFHLVNHTGKILLSDFQERCLWESLIESSTKNDELLQPAQTAQLIKQAWRFLTEWEVPLDTLTPFETQPEVQRLIQWIQLFQNHCDEKNWLSNVQLPDYLINHQQAIILPKKIYLIGFDDITPNINKLLNELKTKCHIDRIEITKKNTTASQLSLADHDDELCTMAAWAKQLWTKNPNKQIACVVPELEKHRKQIHRVFTHTFCPENLLPSASHKIEPFNLSAGQSIDQHDMVKTALLLLRWSYQALPIKNCQYLLQSPYLALNDTEQNMGAQIDAKLREKNLLFVKPNDLFEIIATLHANYPNTTWLTRLRNWTESLTENNQAKTPSSWAQQFIAMLKTLKWPGLQTQASNTFQYLERFKKLLLEFSQLDLLFEKISIQQAVKLLNTLCKQTIFQPKSHKEPIQIMGVLEASGLTFDEVWVMGLHNGIWPPPTKPNPFIPFAIQQQYQMPHATAARELAFCKAVTGRLKTSADNVIFSTPSHAGDQPLLPTKLLGDLPILNKTALNLSSEKTNLKTNTELLTNFIDSTAPPVDKTAEVRGGSQIFKLQATCPFKAFAGIRLNANPLATPHMGIDGATSGTLIHQILFLLWGKIKDQQTLHQLSHEQLSQLIDQAIEEAASEFKTQIIKQKSAYFWQVEKTRLKNIISQWMLYETDRPHFRVAQRETEIHITVNNLPLKLRIDRVDQLADGSYLLIDYKTGTNSVNHWFQERLSEPQLPLYAAFTQADNNTNYTGLAFAEIRTGNITFKGVVSETHAYAEKPAPGFTPINRTKNNLMLYQWEALREHWQVTLKQLASDFCNGVADVNPANAQACQFCELHSLCRH